MPNYPPCVFCGKTDSKPSKEHVLAQWIAREFPTASEWEVVNLETSQKLKRTGNLGLISRKPCMRCNNGWMSRLESAAKPILVPLMKGLPSILTEAQQLIIVRWFIKTVIIHEHLAEAPYFFEPNERKALTKFLEVPSPTLFFLGHYVGSKEVSTHAVQFPMDIPLDKPRPIRIKGYTATLTIKQLVIQVFSVRPPELAPDSPDLNLGFNLPANLSDMALQIWPTIDDNLNWPTPFWLDDGGLDIFKMRWTMLNPPQ